MKKLMTGLLALSLLGGALATSAEARDWDRGDRHQERNWRDNDNRRHADRDRHQRRHWNWTRGQRFAWDRRNYNYYYVDNWNYYHLRRPPRGHRWVRVDGDFLLVAITTGLIADILANRYEDRYDDRYDDRYSRDDDNYDDYR